MQGGKFVEFQIMTFMRPCVCYGKRFLTKNQHTQKKKKSIDELGFVKKCQNCTFKVNFLCQKSTEFFQKKNHLRISI